MCGILLSVCHSIYELELIRNRGPDYNSTITNGDITRYSSVLALRGFEKQPYGNLQFNGEIYLPVASDTKYVFDLFSSNTVSRALEILDSLDAEYAFTWIEGNKIYFGRDYFGRRSLLYSFKEDKLVISSISVIPDMVECECQFWYVFDKDTSELKTISRKSQLPAFQFILDNETTLLKMSEYLHCHSTLLSNFESTFSDSVKDRLFTTADDTFAVLFSGGLDCSLIVLYLDKLLPVNCKIDLLNVAFEHRNSAVKYDVPDRRTSIARHSEFIQLMPNRIINLVTIDVPFSAYLEQKPKIINLMQPHDTVMDLSISIAFWFAARGIGYVNGVPYHSTHKILFSGLGADELFGGYGRHRSAFEYGSWKGLHGSMEMDVLRLPTRNLGRDDRIIADVGKEIRYPFLHPKLVQFVATCPVNVKCDPRLPVGQGDKRILRALAFKNGLINASAEPKRAIQFGSKTAKLEGSKQKGGDKI